MPTAPTPIRLRCGRSIGPGHPAFLVAEIGNNHQGSLDMARKMVRAAAASGACAVKFQKRDMAALFTRAGLDAPYGGVNSFGDTYGRHRDALELSGQALAELMALARSLGLVFFASAWDVPSLRLLVDLGVELLKIPSADCVNLPLLRRAGETGLPIILSTGMSGLSEVDAAVAELRRHHDRIVILHCNSSYPCPDDQVGLPLIEGLRRRYGLAVGYSGHERGLGPTVASVAFAPAVIERHFTDSNDREGPDHKFAMDPANWAKMVEETRILERALGSTDKFIAENEKDTAIVQRRCLRAARDIKAGEVFTRDMIDVLRPATPGAIKPDQIENVIGTKALHDFKYGQELRWTDLGA